MKGYTKVEATRKVIILGPLTKELEGISLLDGWEEWETKQVTKGPLRTILSCEQVNELDTHEEVLFADCDSIVDGDEINDALGVFRASGANGGVTIRETDDPGCSYARIGGGSWVIETREKDPFAPWSTTGPYWFRSGENILHLAHSYPYEMHISPLYNHVNQVKAVPIRGFIHLGTPQLLEEYNAKYCNTFI